MVFRPACLEYAAKSWLTCSKYHEEACSMAANVVLLIFVLVPALERANRVASFLTTPAGKLGTGMPCLETFFCLLCSGWPSSLKPPPTTPGLSLEAACGKSRPNPKSPALSSADGERGTGWTSPVVSSNPSVSPSGSSNPAASGDGKSRSKWNRPRSSVSPLL